MDNIKKNFFILVGLKKIIFSVLTESNEIIFKKELNINDATSEECLNSLKNFLDQNIIYFENKFKFYIENINLIVHLNEDVIVDLSTTKNFNSIAHKSYSSSSYLVNIKDNVVENMKNFNLVHMIINKFIVNGSEYLDLPGKDIKDNLFLEMRFIFIRKHIVENFRKIFSKYEISIQNIFNYDYVNEFNYTNKSSIFDVADKLSKGLNQKEILFIKRPPKNKGFFEKFFNFFN